MARVKECAVCPHASSRRPALFCSCLDSIHSELAAKRVLFVLLSASPLFLSLSGFLEMSRGEIDRAVFFVTTRLPLIVKYFGGSMYPRDHGLHENVTSG